jgi:hypothetical protein
MLLADSRGQQQVGEQQMKKTAFLFLIFATAAYPAAAKPDHHNHRYQHAVDGNQAHRRAPWRRPPA